MSLDRFPVGLEMDVSYPEFQVSLTLLSTTRLKFEIKEGPLARTEVVDIHVLPLGNSLFAVSGTGDILARYDKWRLVPFGEYLPFEALLKPLGLRQFVPLPLGFSAGPGPRTVAIEGTPGFAPLICYEAIFPAEVGHGERPDWLLQITNDAWFGTFSGPYQHLAQARELMPLSCRLKNLT